MFTSIYLIAFVFVLMIFLIPTVLAVRKNHPHKVPIILVNLIGGLLYGVGWLIALVWVLISPSSSSAEASNLPSVADELGKLHQLKESGAISPAEFELQKSKLLQKY